MRKNKFNLWNSLTILISILLPFGLLPISSQAIAQDKNLNETLFTIPIGDNGVHYEGLDNPDEEVWGPAGFTVASDGSFWILDTAANQLLQLSSKGNLLSKINLESSVLGVTDIAFTDYGILILDQASIPPKIIVLTLKGEVTASYDLPKSLFVEDGLTGIATGDRGELLVERSFGLYFTELLDPSGKLALSNLTTNGYIHNGKLFQVKTSGLSSSTPNHGNISFGDLNINIDTEYALGGLQLLGFGPKNDFYVMLEELAQTSALQVDRTVRHYDSSGIQLGMARAPVTDQYVYVQNNLSVGPNGSVYALATYKDRIDVLRLIFVQTLSPILQNAPAVNIFGNITNDQLSSCVSRDSMINIATGYINNSQYLNSTNTDGSCSGRTKPHYIGGAGTYPSVPYAWNKWDNPSTYATAMALNKQAGDADSNEESCAYGTDCSGFVSRAWSLGSKYGTSTIENISTQIQQYQLLYGDILNKSSTPGHTVLYYYTIQSLPGIADFESTTLYNYDRVVFINSYWSRFSTYYVPRKYNSVCP